MAGVGAVGLVGTAGTGPGGRTAAGMGLLEAVGGEDPTGRHGAGTVVSEAGIAAGPPGALRLLTGFLPMKGECFFAYHAFVVKSSLMPFEYS